MLQTMETSYILTPKLWLTRVISELEKTSFLTDTLVVSYPTTVTSTDADVPLFIAPSKIYPDFTTIPDWAVFILSKAQLEKMVKPEKIQETLMASGLMISSQSITLSQTDRLVLQSSPATVIQENETLFDIVGSDEKIRMIFPDSPHTPFVRHSSKATYIGIPGVPSIVDNCPSGYRLACNILWCSCVPESP